MPLTTDEKEPTYFAPGVGLVLEEEEGARIELVSRTGVDGGPIDAAPAWVPPVSRDADSSVRSQGHHRVGASGAQRRGEASEL
jgi:hypothetical protein